MGQRPGLSSMARCRVESCKVAGSQGSNLEHHGQNGPRANNVRGDETWPHIWKDAEPVYGTPLPHGIVIAGMSANSGRLTSLH